MIETGGRIIRFDDSLDDCIHAFRKAIGDHTSTNGLSFRMSNKMKEIIYKYKDGEGKYLAQYDALIGWKIFGVPIIVDNNIGRVIKLSSREGGFKL